MTSRCLSAHFDEQEPRIEITKAQEMVIEENKQSGKSEPKEHITQHGCPKQLAVHSASTSIKMRSSAWPLLSVNMPSGIIPSKSSRSVTSSFTTLTCTKV